MTDHPVLILDAPLFRGIEAEGPFKGERTLFVADPKLTLRNLEPYLAEVDAVYLGSARLQPINFDLSLDLFHRGGKRVCFEIADDKSAQTAIAQVVCRDKGTHHLVFTRHMEKPDGTVVAEWPAADFFYEHSVALGITCSLKRDDGQQVTLTHSGKVYQNVIGSDYAEDVRVDPVL